MACALSQGFITDCRNNTGGIRSFYFASFSNLNSPNIATGSLVNTTNFFVSGSGARFYQYQQRKQTSDFTETATVSDPNGTVYYEQDVTVQLTKLQTNIRNELVLLAQADVVAIVQDMNNSYWLVGSDRGLTLTAGKATTGKNFGDLNGYTLPFKGMESYPMVTVPSGSINALITPA